MKSLKAIALFVLAVLLGGTVFAWRGVYNVAANVPHWDITFAILEAVRDRSVEAHSQGIVAPALNDPELVRKGFQEFNETCRLCHGAPGIARAGFAMGLYPAPPDLASEDVQKESSTAELFWIIKNGLKMTGMPAFGLTEEDKELWEVLAFVRRLPNLKPDEYQTMMTSEGQSAEGESHHGRGHGKDQ